MRTPFRALLLSVLAVMLSVGGSLAPAAAQECGCTDTGAYKAPATAAPVRAAESPGGDYRLEVTNTQTQVHMTLRRASNNTIVESFTVPLGRNDWGFSPDGDRFMYRYGFPGSAQLDEVALYDLANDRQVYATTVTAGAAASFSPHGRYFFLNVLNGPGNGQVIIRNAVTGALALDTTYLFSAIGNPGGSMGTQGTGFSSEEADRSFVLAYRDNNGQTQVAVYNLETRVMIYNTALPSGATALWRFSPCGDAFGIVANQQANTAHVTIRKTATNAAIGSTTISPLPAAIALESTLANHRVKLTSSSGSVTYTNLGSNTADTECAGPPALASIGLNRTSARGGSEHATATLTLTRAATGPLTATLSSSDTSAATVPASVSFATGATTKTFTVTTKAVTASKTVTITAVAGGVTKTATLTVNPPPEPPQSAPRVTGLTLDPATVSGGTSSTATVTLDRPAAASGTVVTLTGEGVATVPATTLIAPGQTSGTFLVATTPVPVDSTATITAAAGGGSASAVLTIRAAQTQPSPEAIIRDPACEAAVLPANDDGSTDAVQLPFPVNFFGTSYDYLFVNNNGNVTFNAPMSTYTPFRITATTPPIIAPFFADVDTRGPGSGLVRHSVSTAPATYGGRPAFCVNWIDVGYYASATDKTNSFQLLLVDRSDVAPGDFDIVMNYDRILWETGSASGGSNGYGGQSAGAGYSAGTGNPAQFFEFPGTLVNGALLDSNPDTGLTRTSRGTLQRGRHIFEVRNGAAPTGATVRGAVTDEAGEAVPGAPVEICPAGGGQCRAVTRTGANGRYQATGIPAGQYLITVRPPAGSTLSQATAGPVEVGESGVVEVDVVLTGPTGPPDDTTISPASTNGQGIPSVYWGDEIDIDTTSCAGGTGTWEVVQGSTVLASGELTEVADGQYTGQIPQLRPASGYAEIRIRITCPDGSVDATDFDIYIDPSGNVRTVLGNPVPGAIVTLYRADTAAGPFEVVPDGSDIMSPSNRANPDVTDGDGHFGWDTIAGFYIVRAQHPECTALDGGDYVETPVLEVPPEVTDLDLRLDCPGIDGPGEDEPISFARVRAELDALVAAGGITEGLEAKIRHALDTAELWLQLDGKVGPALSHLDRAARLLEWQAGVVDKGKTNQGDADGLRALESSVRALEALHR